MARRGFTLRIEVTKQFMRIAAGKFRRLYLYSRSERGSMTFHKLKAMFRSIYGYSPPEGLPLTNIEPLDEFRLVADVPEDRLYGPLPRELSKKKE